MAKYQVKQACSYGKAGDLVEVKGDLTERQKQLLTAYNPKVVEAEPKKVRATGKANDEKSGQPVKE